MCPSSYCSCQWHHFTGLQSNEYLAANVAGKIAVTARGACTRRVRSSVEAGAVAVIMVNNANTFPP